MLRVMSLQHDLLTEIEAFLRAQRSAGTEMAESTFGRLAVNDGKFVQRLRAGKNIGLNTLAKARRYMADTAAKPSRSAA